MKKIEVRRWIKRGVAAVIVASVLGLAACGSDAGAPAAGDTAGGTAAGDESTGDAVGGEDAADAADVAGGKASDGAGADGRASGGAGTDGKAFGDPEKKAGGTGEKKKVTFVLDWTPNTNHTGLYVAQEKGYFDEAGLEVEIVQPPEGGAEVLVASGKAQFGVSFQDTMAPALAGDGALPIKAVAAILQHNTSGIISRKGEGMDRPKGLEGKRYATWESPVELATLQSVVEGDGGEFEKVQLIPNTVTDEVSALKSDLVDAIWIFYGWAGVKTELEGLETDYFAFGDLDPVFDYYTPVVIAGARFLEEEPDTARAFLAALGKGYEEAARDPKGAADILCRAVPELDPELALASQEYLSGQYLADAKGWGYMDPERWDRFYSWLNEKGLVDPKLSEGIGFTNDYLPQ